jgi:hypothetical protein
MSYVPENVVYYIPRCHFDYEPTSYGENTPEFSCVTLA